MSNIKADISFCIKCKNLRFMSSGTKEFSTGLPVKSENSTLAYCELHGFKPPEMGRLDMELFMETGFQSDSGFQSDFEFMTMCIIANPEAYIPVDCVFKLEVMMKNDETKA